PTDFRSSRPRPSGAIANVRTGRAAGVVRAAAKGSARVITLFDAARDLQTLLEGRGWGFCIIGGIAVLRWGEPRFTRDVDVTLLAGFDRENEFIEPIFSSKYRGRISDAADFARRNRVLLLNSPQGVPIDIALGGLPYEALS